jgi:dTDP-glucose 4,6-dehydratase
MSSPQAESHILITGGAGFIGSNFVPFFLRNNPNHRVVNLDKLTYAGDLANLTEIEAEERYEFVQGDICDKKLVSTLFNDYNIEGVIHFAAESHVDNSIENPTNFIKTNIEGTFVLLESARKFWDQAVITNNPNHSNKRFHHISTDEVYGSLGDTGYFTESSPYAPNSPYSASKAAADFLVRSYFHTYDLNVVTSNCSNNYGPKQHKEKLIPTIIRKVLNKEPIPIYGDGKNVRDWLYVEDHCEALNLIFHKGKKGETYLIGGNNEYNNLYIAQHICHLLNKLKPAEGIDYESLITFVKDRPGHDYRYAIDASKIKAELGWQAKRNFDKGLEKTVEWYLKKYQKV